MAFRLTAPGRRPKRAVRAEDQRRREHNGRIGEDVLEAHNNVCLWSGVAVVAKIPTPMVILGSLGNGVFRTSFGKKAGVDYRGHLLDGTARAVYVECKHVEDPARRFPLAEVREKQREQLERAVRDSAVAVLAIVRGPRRDLFALPWSEARGHVSLGDAELREWYVRPGVPYLARWAR